MNTTELTLVAIGVALVFLALLVEIEHRVIWKHYKKNYRKHKNKTMHRLLKPYDWVYKVNIYVVWPLVLVLGVYLIYEYI
jgi:hypothetical protein